MAGHVATSHRLSISFGPVVRSSVSSSFVLESFEHVPAGSGVALARVAGRAEEPLGAVALLIDDGREVRRVAPLSAPQADSGRWAFSVPATAGGAARPAWAAGPGGGV